MTTNRPIRFALSTIAETRSFIACVAVGWSWIRRRISSRTLSPLAPVKESQNIGVALAAGVAIGVGTGVAMGVGVSIGVSAGVSDGVAIGVGVGISIGVGVGVGVAE